ncbi:RNA polymerase sigma factor SigF [Streptomyces sp. NBC_01260]|uniref:RNA polymerase sigma factor SigF n=1 Tax=unclassified Streptomyces TaxID=2593676 RepID=UPI000F4711CA|nr:MULTISPECIES: RNA polymerase sigma factor SigF [unclassified Streptomyces]ROQ77692.1 RNA polymerase sigma-B factor [Streptomyces sp. CEV 2-1]RPK39281.1 RNA polymerase sigma factor SigF [Streptomyces sp. ADI92-24]
MAATTEQTGGALGAARSLSEQSGTYTDAGTSELPWIEDTGKVAPKDARALSKLFLDRLQVLEEGTREYQYARNTLIEMNLSLVRYAASRFRNRGGDDTEDIIQVGTIGLIKAIDRFDLSREVEFATFAVPYIVGEIKRFFRDTTWAVHVPRRLQELRVDLAKAKEQLSAKLDRDPTVKELAELIDLPEEEIIEGLVAANGYSAGSLDSPSAETDSGSDQRSFAETIGEADPGMETVENLHTLAPLLEQLDDRERRIVQMRFGQEMTQSQIGAELGVSQMHVSRLLARIVKQLRAGMSVEA